MQRAVENLRKRKATGGRRKPHRKRRAYEKDRYPIETALGPDEVVKVRVRGGNVKLKVKATQYVNVTDREKGVTRRVKILKVVENPSNRDYQRRGVITKGAVVETELGRARVVSRPAQDGVVNAVLIK